MNTTSVTNKRISKITVAGRFDMEDLIAVEEPLEISITQLSDGLPIRKNISVTMRTPGSDVDLALGFLFTEGILSSYQQVDKVVEADNKIDVVLKKYASIDLSKIERHFYTSSSCGVCGKSSIDAIRTICKRENDLPPFRVKRKLISDLPKQLEKNQAVFEQTGGLHAAALFDHVGKLELVKEDVGRHNALDKLIGAGFQEEILPFDQHLLLLSGRASFELIQKAAMAGIQVVMAVGAPSSLAIELAEEFDITLIGFLSGSRFNVYHGTKRIEL